MRICVHASEWPFFYASARPFIQSGQCTNAQLISIADVAPAERKKNCRKTVINAYCAIASLARMCKQLSHGESIAESQLLCCELKTIKKR